MSVEDVLARLAAAGITVTPRDGMLVLAPTPEIAAEVVANKPALLSALSDWDDAHARRAIADMLQRIERHYLQSAAIGATWFDDELGEFAEAVNTAAQERDRPGFDDALRRYEHHVLERYCTPSAVEAAS